MSANTGIEWTDATWNPIRGCSRVSEGCRNCYAEKTAYRFSGPGKPFEGLVELDMRKDGAVVRLPKWNGKIKFVESMLLFPLSMRKGKRIFVNSMSDLFHEAVTDEMLDRIFAVMALCSQHTFQVLTKRPERMLAYLDKPRGSGLNSTRAAAIRVASEDIAKEMFGDPYVPIYWPLPNVQLGVSVEDQATADRRIPLLLQTPAAVRFISAEPLLGELCLKRIRVPESIYGWEDVDVLTGTTYRHTQPVGFYCNGGLDWVIVGGESGAGARPMHPEWVRGLRDQCVAAGVPFFFKQWGEWIDGASASAIEMPDGGKGLPMDHRYKTKGWSGDEWLDCSDDWLSEEDFGVLMYRAGKKAAGALLDGREWREMPPECAR